MAVTSHPGNGVLLGAGEGSLDLFHHLSLLLGSLHLLKDLNGGRLLLGHRGSSRHVVSARLATSSHIVHNLGPLVSRSRSIDESGILSHGLGRRALGKKGRIVVGATHHASTTTSPQIQASSTTPTGAKLLLLLSEEVGDRGPLGGMGPSLRGGSSDGRHVASLVAHHAIKLLVLTLLLLLHKGLQQYLMLLWSWAYAARSNLRELVKGTSNRRRDERGGAATSYLGDRCHW